MYIHFVDVVKAFDSVHRERLWSIVRGYGIPRNMARVITDIYQDFECAFIDESETSGWFKVRSGIKQGCVTSRFLLLL